MITACKSCKLFMSLLEVPCIPHRPDDLFRRKLFPWRHALVFVNSKIHQIRKTNLDYQKRRTELNPPLPNTLFCFLSIFRKLRSSNRQREIDEGK